LNENISELGLFFGIGVGPGPAGYLPVAALEALQRADTIYLPRARSAEVSVARQCLAGIAIPRERLREIEFTMDPDRAVLRSHYTELAKQLAAELQARRNVVYLTLGDSLTYSTYGYLLAALLDLLPQLKHKTFPGITSYAAAAAALAWPIGEGKERVLILPCPDEPQALQREIETHDIVVLMKIGKRLPWVLGLLLKMGITQHCALASRIGLPGEVVCGDLAQLPADESLGYLSTLLIRRHSRGKRHA
jgi:precorrin-2/cobalt-factor-2 C20-methyltransferase